MSATKIIIRTPNWLGDLMMSTAFIKAVLNYFPESQVDLIVKQGFEQLPLPKRGRVFPFKKEDLAPYAFGKHLRQYNYDRFYVLPPSFSSALMAFAAKARKRYGYYGSLRGFLLNCGQRYQKPHRSQHLVMEYLQLLENWDRKADISPGLDIDEAWIDQYLPEEVKQLEGFFVSIAPGVIYGPAKQWPLSYFKSLLSRIENQGGWVVVIGTENDYTLGEDLSQGSAHVLNLCGKTNLNQLIAVLSRSKALVSNDSGTMHLMAALQKPQVAIFGSTSTIWTGPLNQQAEVVRLDLDCSPCFQRECRFGHYNCLQQIPADLVWQKLAPML